MVTGEQWDALTAERDHLSACLKASSAANDALLRSITALMSERDALRVCVELDRQARREAEQALDAALQETTRLRSAIVDTVRIPYDRVFPSDDVLIAALMRAFKLADGSELLPDWMRCDIDAALAPTKDPA